MIIFIVVIIIIILHYLVHHNSTNFDTHKHMQMCAPTYIPPIPTPQYTHTHTPTYTHSQLTSNQLWCTSVHGCGLSEDIEQHGVAILQTRTST